MAQLQAVAKTVLIPRRPAASALSPVVQLKSLVALKRLEDWIDQRVLEEKRAQEQTDSFREPAIFD